MKFTALILSFLLSFNVMAQGLTSLEAGLDNYQFAMTVEWDQKDQQFYQVQTEKFFKVIEASLSEGVTKADVLKLAALKMKDPKALAALELKMNVLTPQANSSAELINLLQSSSKDFYQRGASWEGDVVLTVGIASIIVAAVAYAIWWSVKYKCTQEEVYSDCGWEDDYNGGSNYDCHDKTRCTDWEERD